ncbi:MAG: diguanylate cyclase [Pseudomonadota bacterium]
MKILVVDRDRLTSQMIRTKLEGAGHTIIEEAVKNNAIEMIGQNDIDAVFFDPAPLTNARPIVLGIRRSVSTYTYICMMSHNLSVNEAADMGANDLLMKPVDGEQLIEKSENAKRMVDLVNRIGDESEDFPSAGGVIAKSAFNQLFLSAIDRADRYGERSYIVFISLSNYDDIKTMDGAYAAEYAVSKMAQYLVRLRRQSDIIAQTGANEYALLLQRPQQENEPMEAASRFASSLSEFDDIVSGGATPVEITVSLVDIPVCNSLFKRSLMHQPQQTQSAT